MSIGKYVSVAMWALGAVVSVSTSASTAAAAPAVAAADAPAVTAADDTIPLEGSQCWGRCSACASRCASALPDERERCTRTCQADNDHCCEAAGRHGAARACGCY